ncbi:MAG: DUF2934 domain-containing protein [Rhizomicrobium sp.]
MTYEKYPITLPPETIEPTEEAIRLRSYQIWEREGRPEGCAQEHWAYAKAELEAEMQEASLAGLTTDIVLPRLHVSTPPVRSISEKVASDIDAGK